MWRRCPASACSLPARPILARSVTHITDGCFVRDVCCATHALWEKSRCQVQWRGRPMSTDGLLPGCDPGSAAGIKGEQGGGWKILGNDEKPFVAEQNPHTQLP